MPVEDPELDALFRETSSQVTRERCLADDAVGPRGEQPELRASITLRLKPDRRSVVTRIDPALERRRR
jgi:hypothetical protein